MSTILKNYYDFADVFSKSKASKLADHQTYDLKITLDKVTSHLWSNILLVPGGTATLHKFIDENLATGLICPLALPMDTSPLYSEERWLSSTLHWFPRPQPNFQERPIPTSVHFRLLDAPWKGMSLNQNRSPACIPPCTDFTWDKWRLHSNLLWFIWWLVCWRAYIFRWHPHLFWQHFQAQAPCLRILCRLT